MTLAACAYCGRPTGNMHKRFCTRECARLLNLEGQALENRVRLWNRDGGKCALCGTNTDIYWRCFKHARGYDEAWVWEIDHIQPRSEGGTDEMENLRTLCIKCHYGVSEAQKRARFDKIKNASIEAHAKPMPIIHRG